MGLTPMGATGDVVGALLLIARRRRPLTRSYVCRRPKEAMGMYLYCTRLVGRECQNGVDKIGGEMATRFALSCTSLYVCIARSMNMSRSHCPVATRDVWPLGQKKNCGQRRLADPIVYTTIPCRVPERLHFRLRTARSVHGMHAEDASNQSHPIIVSFCFSSWPPPPLLPVCRHLHAGYIRLESHWPNDSGLITRQGFERRQCRSYAAKTVRVHGTYIRHVYTVRLDSTSTRHENTARVHSTSTCDTGCIQP
jgi:hypothetical protein